MANHKLAVHETLELHEILSMKTHCVNMANLFLGMITDEELKGLYQQDISKSTQQIAELKTFLESGTNLTV